jgi:hypothetical protein
VLSKPETAMALPPPKLEATYAAPTAVFWLEAHQRREKANRTTTRYGRAFMTAVSRVDGE